MKISKSHTNKNGFVTILNVVIIGGFMLTLMAIAYRASIRSLEGQKKVQLQIDYDAREQAFLRSVVTLAPVYAANTMRNQSNGDAKATFAGLYGTAASWANLEDARAADAKTSLDFSALSNGNTGNINNGGAGINDARDYVGHSDDSGQAAGYTRSALRDADYGNVPKLNDRSGLATARSKSSPLITSDATYGATGTGVGDPRDFNLIPYPDIHFGYGTPGTNFIARQNWWQLYMHANKVDGALTGVGVHESEYILSIYEIPAQLAISSSTFTNLGSSSWDSTKVNITGPVYAKKANVTGAVVDGIATTEGVSGILGGTAQGMTREAYEAANPTTFYPISKASDYARSLFLPINTGLEFFDAFASTDTAYNSANRLSRESWNSYSRGCHQCVMKLTVTETAGGSGGIQTPIEFTFTYKTSSGTENTITVSKAGAGILWPDADDGEFPFISEVADNRSGIAIYLDRIASWLTDASQPAIDFTLSNSLVVNADYTQTTVDKPAFPSTSNDTCVIVRGCEDLTQFTNGFSLVTNYPLYLLEDFNQVQISGVDPATSLFAPEIRYGTGDSSRLVVFTGQAGNLSTSGNAVELLDMKGSGDVGNVSGSVSATLKPILTLAELPPVNVMNWLVVVQKK